MGTATLTHPIAFWKLDLPRFRGNTAAGVFLVVVVAVVVGIVVVAAAAAAAVVVVIIIVVTVVIVGAVVIVVLIDVSLFWLPIRAQALATTTSLLLTLSPLRSRMIGRGLSASSV